jgi:hypothetical protein
MDTDRFLKVGGDAMDRAAGVPLFGFARAVLSDPKSPDPVVPPDLHLVKPVIADASGTVPCVLCGKRVAWDAAQMMGSLGYACGVCVNAGLTAPEDTRIRRRLWPWVAGIMVVLIGGGFALWRHLEGKAREELEREYPIAASTAELAAIDLNLERWSDLNKLAIAIDDPPKLDSLSLGAACDREIDRSLRFRSDHDDLSTIRMQLRDLVAAAKRGRFRSEWERLAVVREIEAPVLAVRHVDRRDAKIENGHAGIYDGGHVTGVAYLFEPDGTLACAGEFTAASSESINVEITRIGTDDASYDPNRDRPAVKDALRDDLEAQATKAIAPALRRVR